MKFKSSATTYTGITAVAKGSNDGSTYGTSLETIQSSTSVSSTTGLAVSAGTYSGYTFFKWVASGSGTFANANSATTTFYPSANSEVATAQYKKNYTFSNGTTDTHGTVTVPSGTVLAGASYSGTVTPADGYKINTLTVGGVAVSAAVGKTSAYTYSGTTGSSTTGTTTPISVVATFTAIPVTTIYIKKTMPNFNKIYLWSNSDDKWNGNYGGEVFTSWSTTADDKYYYKSFTKDYSTFKFILNSNNSNTTKTNDSAAYATGKSYYINTASTGSAGVLTEGTPTAKTITYSGSNCTFGGTKPATAYPGDSVSFTVTASSGYRVDSVKYNDGTDHTLTASSGTYTFTMPNANVTVTATTIKTYTVTLTAGTGFATKKYKIGSSGTQQTYSSAITVDTGSVVIFDVTYSSGYQFSSASSNVTASNSNKTFTTGAISADTAVTLNAAQITYPVQIAAFKMDDTTTGYVPFSSASTGAPTVSGTPSITYSSTSIAYSGTARTVTKNSTDPSGYTFVGWYKTTNVSSTVTSIPADYSVTTGNSTTFTPNGTAGSTYYRVIALYKKNYYITLYDSYMRENEYSDWKFVAAPPRTVKVGSNPVVANNTNSRAVYTYASGTAAQRGEENVKSATGTYYEGNKLLVLAGEKVLLIYSTLASSDAIRGIFYNNDRRFTTETEDNNLYYHRVYKAGGWGDAEHGYDSGVASGDVPDDDWDYDYMANTTLRADPGYYDTGESPYSNILTEQSSYVATVDQSAHTVSWTAQSDYLNIDLELDYKYQLHINNDEWEGLKIENMNDEGYYFGGETFNSAFKISIDNTGVTDGEYSFTGITATIKDKDGNTISSGVTVSPKQSNGSAATTTSNLSYFLVSGTMPRKNVYITIPAVKKYKMKLANIVVSDNGSNKRTMLTETSGSATNSTGQIGTITAVPKKGNTTLSDISTDGNYETYPSNNNAGEVSIYTSGSNSNNKYLKGGVNKNGSLVEDGYTVTYTFTFASGKDAEYTFVGWFEGDQNGDTFTPNYNKKLSGKLSFTYTPTKDAVIFAVGTRDVYIGGNFTKDGAYTATSSSQTWASNRILMDFDPTYTNPNDSTKKGRYVYKFESVTANTEYQFRCYDTASGSQFANLTVWNTWLTSSNGGSTGYNTDSTDISMYRDKYDAGSGNGWTSHGGFMYTTATNKKITAAREQGGSELGQTHNISANHQANGYAAPVEVYFYAYDGGITVNSTYQWSRAYVSEGRGIDVKTVVAGATNANGTTYNVPTASVANKTVNNKDVTVTTQASKYGSSSQGKYEKIYECLVKENNGQIKVTVQSNDANVELQAFLVYNIDTKKSEAVKTFTSTGSGESKSWTGNITIPNNSKIYVVPIYKFTDDYITAQHLETHNVYVRAEDIDKDDWGGLVAMYSWGTDPRYTSGGWPGQLMIPSDDGQSFYAPLTFTKNQLAGVTFNNYTPVWGSNFINFLGTYQREGVSDTVYSGYTKSSYSGSDKQYIYQVYDYREPISIIDNLDETNPRIYDSEDMTLTFALKPGNKTTATIENGAYNASFDYEYLTDSSGKSRVDLNGNKLSTNSTATYYVVCNYTEAYKTGGTKTYGFTDGSRNGTTTHNMYSIDWNVYDINGTAIAQASGSNAKLSAAFTDVYKGEMLTYIAKVLVDNGYPVSGKAVKIAYENPKVSSSDKTEAVRYSGQWYADSINTLIEGNVRVGIYADGAWLPSDSNAPGYATATVEFSPNTSIGEGYVTEDGCTGNSLAKVTKIHAANGDVTFRVSTTTNFLGWYRSDGKGGYEPIGSNYKNQAVSLSFNEDMTYYAFYTASATYRFQYTGRDGLTKYYTAQGTSLTEAEMSAGGTLNPSSRSSDISSKLAKISDITVFNRTLTYALTAPDTSAPYTITYAAGNSENTYTLTVWSYNSSGSLVQKGSVSGTWSTALDVTNNASLGNGESLVDYKPSGQSNNVFVGWKKKGDTSNTIISTQANFGYSITQDMAIEPVFGAARVTDESWQAGIDKNVITQELTDASTGTIYNDSLVSFKCKKATGEILDPSENECGLIILSQTGASSDNSTYSNNFDTISASKMQGYITTLRGNNQTAAKLKATTYGDAYALIVTADSLSRLNRADLYQNLDYSTFTNGKYKVMTYVKVGGTYSYSEPIEAVYTNGQKFPTV